MRIRSAVMAAIFALAFLSPVIASGSADESDPIVAQVGEVVIRASELQSKVDEIPTYARQNFLTREGKLKLLQNMIKGEILYQAALAEGFDRREDIQAKIEDARRRILQSEYYRLAVKDGQGEPDPEEARAYYESNRSQFTVPARSKVAHVLLESREEAEKVLKRLRAGGDIAQLAAELSKDRMTSGSGGDLGWITRDGFIRGLGRDPGFEEAVAQAEVGRPAGPVQSAKGWHVFLVQEREPERIRPYEEVAQEVAQALQVSDEAVQAEYEAHREDYKSRARLKARHILTGTYEEAQAIRSELLAGADFQTLARERSKDKITAQKGGDLGYIYREGYVKGLGRAPEFEKAVFELEIGAISEPISSKKGFHLVTVYEREDERFKDLDEVRSQIRNKLLRESKEKGEELRFKALEESYSVQIHEERIADSSPEE